jgi:protein ImuB
LADLCFANSQEPIANSGFPMPFACIFVSDFSLQAILRAEPGLRSQAVAVLEGKPPLEKILVANERARAAGVLPGMTKLQIEGSAEIVLRDRSELQESVAHQALLDCAQAFSPRIEDSARDTVLLDLSGLDKLFGPLPKVARGIFHRAHEMGLEINVAVAGTLASAALAANGFAGVTVIPEGKEAEVLGGLPIEALFAAEVAAQDRLDSKQLYSASSCLRREEILETFRSWGIRKFRDLGALPETALSERLGQRGLELQRKACGKGDRMLVPSDPPLVFEEAIELDFPLVLLEPLAFLLNQMLEQLCMRLQSRSLAAQEIHLRLTLENGRQDSESTFERVIHLPVPLLDANTFLKLLQLDLKAHPPGAPVKKVHLRIEPAKPRPGQNGLFVPCSPEPEKLELTLARISAVVGEGYVGSPQLLGTHRSQAFEMRRFGLATNVRTAALDPSGELDRQFAGFSSDTKPKPSTTRRRRGVAVPTFAGIEKNSSNGNGANPNLVTALRIFRPPILVAVKQQDGKPTHILSKTRNHISTDVLWAAGPWRCSGDWWEQDAWVRDEWDIAVQEKTGIVLYRLVHDVLAGRWMLEGSYD